MLFQLYLNKAAKFFSKTLCKTDRWLHKIENQEIDYVYKNFVYDKSTILNDFTTTDHSIHYWIEINI